MAHIKPPLALGLLALALAQPLHPAQAHTTRAPDMTRHRDMLYVTVARIATETSIYESTYYSDTPSRGNVYLTVWLRAVNRNDVQLVLDPSDFSVVTPDGRSLDADYNTPNPELGQAVLDVGGRTGGSITFQVPARGHHVILRWSPSPGSYQLHWSSVSWPVSY